MDYIPIPSIIDSGELSEDEVKADCAALRAEMKGLGGDGQPIYDLLTARSNKQRQQIKERFLREYGRDLLEDLKAELDSKYEDIIIALMYPPIEYLCKELHDAMSGIVNESTLEEILFTKTSEEMTQIVATYEEIYKRPLVEHICSVTSYHFGRLLTSIITEPRPVGTINMTEAREQALKLYDDEKGKLGVDEEELIRIFTHTSFAQLDYVFEIYKYMSGKYIEQDIARDMSADLHDAMKAIVEIVQSQPAFFARRLFKFMNGIDEDDTTFVRIIVGRSEIDFENIQDEFVRLYDRDVFSTLEEMSDECTRLCDMINAIEIESESETETEPETDPETDPETETETENPMKRKHNVLL